LQEVWQSFADGWRTLHRNWILVWFPFLIVLGLALLLIMIVVGMALSSGGLRHLSDLDRLYWSEAVLLIRRFAFLAVLVFLAAMAVLAGQANMYACASAGEPATIGHFFDGIRRMYWRFLGGNLLLAAAGFVFTVIFFGGLMQQLWFHLQSNPRLDMGALFAWALSTAPLAIAGWVLFLVAGILLSMWTKLVAIEDLSATSAILGSVRLVVAQLGPFLALSVISWLASRMLQGFGDSGGLASLLTSLAEVIWATYYQLVLFIFYRKITGTPSEQPPETTVPPLLEA
jgi:hypothetical protein